MQNSIDNVFKSLEKRTLRRVAVEIVTVHGQEDPLAYRRCDDRTFVARYCIIY